MQGQQARKELTAAQMQRARDKESKRARGALSCAECRRYLLHSVDDSSARIDEVLAIQSQAQMRQDSAVLKLQTAWLFRHMSQWELDHWAGDTVCSGSISELEYSYHLRHDRFVLADTEKLHQKISMMSDRIRQLEDALAILQSTQTRDSHPLLSRDLLKIKSIIELHAAGDTVDDASGCKEEDMEESQTIDAFGTLAIRDDGAATFYGRSAGQESLLIDEVSVPHSPGTTSETQTWILNATLPPNVKALASSFPFLTAPPGTSSIHVPPPHGIDFDTLIHTYLPNWEEAQRLCALYLEQAPWFFGAVTRRQLEEEVLPTWYDEAPRLFESQGPFAPGTPHDLALLFILLTFGALTDSAALATATATADAYYTLTKAALALSPVLERPPSVATVQTLSLMAIYEGMSGREHSIEATWALMGMATKLAQSIGLHRDCARWNLPPAEVQKRRALFWELFITDCWQSLATGRLATFSLPFVDCELPFDPDQTMTNDGIIQPSFPFWKARFGAECVAGVVQGTLTSRAPKYSIILHLDRKVRDMELPAYAQGPAPQGAGLAQTMSHFMPINYRELTLLYIHRCFFAHAIVSNSTDPIRSQYAPSFLAGYRSACTIIGSVRQQFNLFPAQIARFWVLWTHAFSASVMLASVVTHSSQSKVAPAALIELRAACELFEQASTYGGRSSKFLPILLRLQTKAQKIFMDTNSGIPPSIPGDIFRPTPLGGERQDSLSIFSGKTHTLTTKAALRTPHSTITGSSSSGSPSSISDSSNAPSHVSLHVDITSFTNVHPSLVMELHGFDGHIAAQIGEAYKTSNTGFSSRMEAPQQEYASRCHMELGQKEMTERDKLERCQAEMEQRQVYQERRGKEQRHQLQEQEQYYRQQQQAVHEQEAQRQFELDRQRQQPCQYHPDVQRPHQAPSQHYHHHLDNDHHHIDHTSERLSTRPVTDFDPVASNLLSSVNPTSAQLERPTLRQLQPAHQHSVHASPPEYWKNLDKQPPPSQPVPVRYIEHEQPNDTHRSLARVQPRQATDHSTAGAMRPHEMEYEQQYTSHAQLQSQPADQAMYQYWAPDNASNSSINQVTQVNGIYGHLQQQNQYYTPDGALRGIAADDTSLQETWQTYMYNVGSPRQFLED